MNGKPSTSRSSPRAGKAPDETPRRPDPSGAGGPAAEGDDGPLDSLGKAVGETVLGADRTTVGDRVREKLERKTGPAGG